MGLGVEYQCGDTSAMTMNPRPYFQFVNNGSSTVDLSTLTIRYFYTKDGTPDTDQSFECDYAQIGCSAISGAFGTWTGTNADEYLEISFQAGAGTLGPGAGSGPIQTRFHPSDYAYTFNQMNDYSFDATKTAYAAWTQVTLYQGGTLVWGTEP
jgi:hypothetical protein